MPALSVEGLSVQFGVFGAVAHVVTSVTFDVRAGETIAIVGESGSGKTMTALAVMGLLPDGARVSGQVNVAGKRLTGVADAVYREVRGRDVAMVFQEPMTALNPVMRVGAQVAEAIRVHRKGVSRRAAWQEAVALLDEVGVSPARQRARAFPHELSGGQRQRVLIAMALANRPSVLLADEPTTALDVTTQAQILELLGRLRDAFGLALVLITHDLAVVAGIADRVYVMYGGRIVESGIAADVFARAGHPYTRGLLGALPGTVPPRAPLAAIPGGPPDPSALPFGCAFHPRCPIADDRCRRSVPEPRGLGEGHLTACVYGDRVSLGLAPA